MANPNEDHGTEQVEIFRRPIKSGVLRVTMQDYKGVSYTSIRVWETTKNGQRLYPTNKGVQITTEDLVTIAESISDLLKSKIIDDGSNNYEYNGSTSAQTLSQLQRQA